MKRLLFIALILPLVCSGRVRLFSFCQQGGVAAVTNSLPSSNKLQASYPGATVNVYYTSGASGYVTTAGTAVTWAAGTVFNANSGWSGLTITINSVAYTISSVSSINSITLSSSAGTQATPVTYSMPATAPAAIYSDNTGTVKANPYTCDSTAQQFIYGDNGTYDFRFSGTGIITPFTISAVSGIDPLTVPLTVSSRSYIAAGKTFYQACLDAAMRGLTLVIDQNWYGISTSATCLVPVQGGGGMIQPAAGQTVTFTLQSAGLSKICDISLGGNCVITGPNGQVIPQWWGAVSDSVTDNTAAMTASIKAAIAAHQTWYLPPASQIVTTGGLQTCYLVSAPLVVIGPLAMLSAALSQGTTGTQTGAICETDPTKDILQIYGANGGLSVRNISFLHLAGFATVISAATATTITLVNPSNVTLSTLPAPALNYLMTVFTWQTYSNAGNIYRVTAGAGGAGTQIPALGSGGVLPTGTGTETHNGITYVYKGNGATFQQGQIAASAQWWFHGYGSGILTDVTPSQGGTGTPNNFDGMGGSVVGNVPYFVSLAYQGNNGSNNAAFIHVFTGTTFPITGNYCLQAPGNCILLEPAAQNGLIQGNVLDGGYNGVKGELTQTIVTGNEWYGPLGCAITSTDGQAVTISNEQFTFGNGICLTTAYVPGVTPDSALAYLTITGNRFFNTNFALQATGVTGLMLNSNQMARTENGPVILLSNVDRSQLNANSFVGAGESGNSTATQMMKFTGIVKNNMICSNTFQRVNTGQSVTTIYDWSSAPTQEALNFICPDSLYDPFYRITTGTVATMNPPLANNTSGTFTPALAFGGSSTGITYAGGFPVGSYVVNGNEVTVRVAIALTNKGGATGSATITGLPIPASSLFPGGARFAGAFASFGPFSVVLIPFVGINTGHAYLELFKNGGGSVSAITDTDFTNGTTMELSITYSQQ